MKKILFLFAVIGLSTSTTFAQEYVKIGPEVGGIMATMDLKYDGIDRQTNFQFGYRLGATVDLGFNDNFSLQSGLYLSTNNGTRSVYINNFATGGGVPASINDERTYSITYVQLPIYALFKTGDEFSSRFFIGAGPYVGVGIGGRYKQDYTNKLNGQNLTKHYNYPINFGTTETDEIRRMDFGLQATTGLETKFGLYFRLHYGYGLLNTAPIVNANNVYHNSGGGISIGYFFKVYDRNRY